MKIKKLEFINFGIFKNFKWDTSVPIFHDKVNIILGWNGSGKTIISRILRSYENGKIEAESKIAGATYSIQIDGVTKKQGELTGYENKIRVFNEDYIKEIIDQTHLKYVVAIGAAEVDFSKKQKELDGANDELSKLPKCRNEYDEISQRISQNIKVISGIGHIKKDPAVESSGAYNSYNKSSFEKRTNWLAAQIEQGSKIDKFIKSENELKSLLATLSGLSEKEREYRILKKWNDWRIAELSKINKYLQFNPNYVKSARLNGYPDGGKEEDWVRDGLGIHKLFSDQPLESCLFCDSKISNIDELLKHFSNDVIELNEALGLMARNVDEATMEIMTCQKFYSTEKSKLEASLAALKASLKSKKENKTKPVNPCIFENLFPSEEIFEVEQTAWDVEAHHVASEYSTYFGKKHEYESSFKKQEDKKAEIKTLEQELKALKEKASNFQIPADRINNLLAATFPYKKIELDGSTEAIGYVLKREGTPCNLDSLSEGERNFLALAYFLLSINDEGEKLDNDAVVVIDDPVSSLDSDSLFQVYAILENEMNRNDNRQYFVLTHNLDFFGHLLQNYKTADGNIKDGAVIFYQTSITGAGSSLVKLDKTLKNYRSDYLYATTKLNEIKNSTNLDDAILAANLLRRSLETFLHFKYGHGDFRTKLGRLYASYKKAKLGGTNPAQKAVIEQEVDQENMAMLRFVNHGSHEFMGFSHYDISILQASKQRIENYFSVIRWVDPDHYNTFGI